MKARLVAELGFDAIVEQAFTREFAGQSAEEFVADILERNLGISHAVTGFDFHFGKDRRGGPAFLMASGERHGFGVSLVDPFRDEGAEIVSSSRIRSLLGEGDVAEAAGLLGYRFRLPKRSFAASSSDARLAIPPPTWCCRRPRSSGMASMPCGFSRADGSLHDGVASFGRRPTVDVDGAPLLETFVFDFSGDLYGETCTVSFFGFLRGEEKFEGLDALVAQMRHDEAEARALLAGVRPLSALDARISFAL